MDYQDIALFTDLDGTLFNSHRQISAENRAAIARFISEGGSFGISTGRAAENAKLLLPDIQINTWSVVLNGAGAYHFADRAAVAVRSLPKEPMAQLIRWTLANLPEVNIQLCTDGPLLFLSAPDLSDDDFVSSHQPMETASVTDALAYTWLKVLFCAPRPILEQVKAYAEATGAASAMHCLYTSEVYFEFLPLGANKGSCLNALRRRPELRGKTFIAIGDYTNDLELLREADIAIAVDNALPEVKAIADHIVCTNDEHAIAHLIHRLIPQL